MTRKAFAGPFAGASAGAPVRIILALVAAGLILAATATAAEYELRLAPYDDPKALVTERVGSIPGWYWSCLF